MNRSLAFVIAVACVVFSAMPVQAADVPARTNPPSFYKAPWELPFSWTGFYAGINGGYAWGHSSWSDPAVGTDSGNLISPADWSADSSGTTGRPVPSCSALKLMPTG